MVYFIEQGGAVKIGFSKNPVSRLMGLQTSNPGELILRLLIEGTEEDEKMYHRKFEDRLIRGEWFMKAGAVEKFIEENIPNDLRYDYGLLYNARYEPAETTRVRKMMQLRLRHAADRLGITPQSIKEIETREVLGTVSINCLRRYATAMGYRLVYKFVKGEEEIPDYT